MQPWVLRVVPLFPAMSAAAPNASAQCVSDAAWADAMAVGCWQYFAPDGDDAPTVVFDPAEDGNADVTVCVGSLDVALADEWVTSMKARRVHIQVAIESNKHEHVATP